MRRLPAVLLVLVCIVVLAIASAIAFSPNYNLTVQPDAVLLDTPAPLSSRPIPTFATALPPELPTPTITVP